MICRSQFMVAEASNRLVKSRCFQYNESVVWGLLEIVAICDEKHGMRKSLS